MATDYNETELQINDAVMYIDNNGGEFEGVIKRILDNNKIEIETDDIGFMIVDASLTFVLL